MKWVFKVKLSLDILPQVFHYSTIEIFPFLNWMNSCNVIHKCWTERIRIYHDKIVIRISKNTSINWICNMFKYHSHIIFFSFEIEQWNAFVYNNKSDYNSFMYIYLRILSFLGGRRRTVRREREIERAKYGIVKHEGSMVRNSF